MIVHKVGHFFLFFVEIHQCGKATISEVWEIVLEIPKSELKKNLLDTLLS